MNIFDNILLNKKKIKEKLLSKRFDFLEKKVAILTGSTIDLLKDTLEIYLLYHGIKPTFYISEYNKYYEDAVFENLTLDEFKPDIVYIFTTFRNINIDIDINLSKDEIDSLLENEFNKYKNIWESIIKKYNPVIIQNNFEYPNYRLLGNNDIVNVHGLSNFINKLNNKFYEYAENNNIHILDINYIASDFGLSKWHNNKLYALYKIPCNIEAIPYIAFNAANIIKSIYGKNKKLLALDLDNTLWGGVVSEDGINGIEIGKETAIGELYYDFQNYIKKLKSIGVLLSIVSKNDEDIAIDAIQKSDGVLKKDDFVDIKANWQPKNENINKISEELNLGIDSFVFIDDNPMERDIVKTSFSQVEVPDVKDVDEYISAIDKAGFFENTIITKEDLDKTKNYQKNIAINEFKSNFKNYDDYLDSLDMKATILPFEEKYFDRISQLSNKSNQFNLTTKRYSVEDIKNITNDKNHITLYGKLDDKFGENGIVSLIIGKIVDTANGKELNIDLLLMSCRVLKRDMEYAMMDELVRLCNEKNIISINGFYYKTDKNNMVSDLYEKYGYDIIKNDDNEKIYKLSNLKNYKNKNKHILVNKF